jgi:hypothetical protein
MIERVPKSLLLLRPTSYKPFTRNDMATLKDCSRRPNREGMTPVCLLGFHDAGSHGAEEALFPLAAAPSSSPLSAPAACPLAPSSSSSSTQQYTFRPLLLGLLLYRYPRSPVRSAFRSFSSIVYAFGSSLCPSHQLRTSSEIVL